MKPGPRWPQQPALLSKGTHSGDSKYDGISRAHAGGGGAEEASLPRRKVRHALVRPEGLTQMTPCPNLALKVRWAQQRQTKGTGAGTETETGTGTETERDTERDGDRKAETDRNREDRKGHQVPVALAGTVQGLGTWITADLLHDTL